MYDDMSEAYPDPIHEKLFPYYQNLEEAASLLADAPDTHKQYYFDFVVRSFQDLRIAKNMLKD
jgi:hypothetical protein